MILKCLGLRSQSWPMQIEKYDDWMNNIWMDLSLMRSDIPVQFKCGQMQMMS